MDASKTILSCIQPTGNVHLGRYFGAIANWVKLQEEYTCYYGIVNYHAQTMPYDPDKLRFLTWDVAFKLHACGIDIDNIFIQSLVPEHTELAWILSCMTSYGYLSRMTQFKDKSQQIKDQSKEVFISAGLFTYPVLQAADILIYRPKYVPVGKDQEQHLELTRDIASRFNQAIGTDYFPLPEPLFTPVPKVMSTAEPTKKMSASMGDKHNIDLFAEPKRIEKQIKSAVTDSGDVQYPDMSPGVDNLFSLLTAAGEEKQAEELRAQYQAGSLRYGDLKVSVAEAIIAFSQPFRDKMDEISKDRKGYKQLIKNSSYKTRQEAQKTLQEIRSLTGLI